jgi:hypothetical protein
LHEETLWGVSFGIQIKNHLISLEQTHHVGAENGKVEYLKCLVVAVSVCKFDVIVSFDFIGIFSIFVLIATFIAIGLILYMSSTILSKSPAEVEADNHIKLTDGDRDYKTFEILYLPIFCANMMSLFEGN